MGQEQQGMVLSPRAGAPAGRGLTLRSSPAVLCAERVVRITKTYHDIDAVTNLLDEVHWCPLVQGLGACGTPRTWGEWGLGKGGRAGAGSRLMQTCPLQKERDLELAARIGQSLLKQNRSLTERNELLEEQLELAKEEVTAPGCRLLASPIHAQLRGGHGPLGHALMPLPLPDCTAAP